VLEHANKHWREFQEFGVQGPDDYLQFVNDFRNNLPPNTELKLLPKGSISFTMKPVITILFLSLKMVK
jgi:pyocin large subunit-like protein